MAFQNVQGGPAIAPGVMWRGHEPVGYTLESDQPFTSLPSEGWAGFFTYSLVSDAGGLKSPPNAFQISYPTGYGGGDSPGMAECGLAGRKKLYFCAAVKFSSGWQGHNTGVNKIAHFWIGGINHLFLVADGSDDNPLLAGIGIQGVVDSPVGGGDQVNPNIVTDAQFIRGQWHQIEMLAVANTAGTRDGSVDIWLDGVHVSRVDTIEWVSGAQTWDDVKLDPTWGGALDSVASTQTFRCDHVYMSSSN